MGVRVLDKVDSPIPEMREKHIERRDDLIVRMAPVIKNDIPGAMLFRHRLQEPRISLIADFYLDATIHCVSRAGWIDVQTGYPRIMPEPV